MLLTFLARYCGRDRHPSGRPALFALSLTILIRMALCILMVSCVCSLLLVRSLLHGVQLPVGRDLEQEILVLSVGNVEVAVFVVNTRSTNWP